MCCVPPPQAEPQRAFSAARHLVARTTSTPDWKGRSLPCNQFTQLLWHCKQAAVPTEWVQINQLSATCPSNQTATEPNVQNRPLQRVNTGLRWTQAQLPKTALVSPCLLDEQKCNRNLRRSPYQIFKVVRQCCFFFSGRTWLIHLNLFSPQVIWWHLTWSA